MTKPPNFNWIARPYRWLEYLSFGPMLERCRFRFLDNLSDRRHALILGDGDGRFAARLLAGNRQIKAVAVDFSGEMLKLLTRRVAALGDEAMARLQTWNGDALEFASQAGADEAPYDLIASHFFLDCLTGEDVFSLIGKLRPHLAPGAIWLVSEFAIPEGRPKASAARMLVASLYLAFGLATGLAVRRLPDYAAALQASGFVLSEKRSSLGGILVSEIWSWNP